MSNKPGKKSALYFYVIDMAKQKGLQGTIPHLIESLYVEWKALSPNKQAPYERKFEEYKKNQRETKNLPHVPPVPYLSGVKQEETGARTRHETIQRSLTDFFETRLSKSSAAGDYDQHMQIVKQQPFYFIKFQTFCKSEVNPYASGLEYSPFYYVLAEVGLVEYSLEHGITNTYHAFIKPNTVPLGYRSQCMESESNVHNIPLMNFNLITSTYPEIYSNIRTFTQPHNSNNFYAPIFCLGKDIEQTRFGLKFLQDQSGEIWSSKSSGKEFYENVYDAECLFMYLAEVCGQPVSYSSANEDLTRYTYDYSPNISCEFHENKSGVVNCALSICKRLCYLTSDVLCQQYDVEMTENHLPIEREAGVRVAHLGLDNLSCSSRNAIPYAESHTTSVMSSQSGVGKRGYDTKARSRMRDEFEDDGRTSKHFVPDNDGVTFRSHDIRPEFQQQQQSRQQAKAMQPLPPKQSIADRLASGWNATANASNSEAYNRRPLSTFMNNNNNNSSTNSRDNHDIAFDDEVSTLVGGGSSDLPAVDMDDWTDVVQPQIAAVPSYSSKVRSSENIANNGSRGQVNSNSLGMGRGGRGGGGGGGGGSGGDGDGDDHSLVSGVKSSVAPSSSVFSDNEAAATTSGFVSSVASGMVRNESSRSIGRGRGFLLKNKK